MKKRYIAFVTIAVLVLPKLIDYLFTVYICDLTALEYLEAGDLLSYAGVLASVGATVAALYISLKQFKLLNRTFIIPINTKYYFYCKENNGVGFLATENDIAKDNQWAYVIGGPYYSKLRIELKNIGKGTANNFSVRIKYNNGKWFYDLMLQLGYSKGQCGLQSNFDENIYNNCGIVNSGDYRTIKIPIELNGILENICRAQYLNYKSKNNQQSMKNNVLVDKEHKVCSIEISSTDIMDITKIEDYEVYDVYIQVVNTISLVSKNNLYSEVYLIMKQSE